MLGIDRCFARDLTPLADAARLQSLHLSYDCWSIMGVTFPRALPAIQQLRLMAALQVTVVPCWSGAGLLSNKQTPAFQTQVWPERTAASGLHRDVSVRLVPAPPPAAAVF